MNKFIFILIFFASFSICSAQTGIWNELHPTNSPSPREAFGMAEIGDGKVLIFGGGDVNNIFDETWIFDIKENIWKQITSNPHPVKRFDHSMARITKNKVLLFGGWNPEYFNDTWIFDLDSLKWTEIHPLIKPTRRRAFGLTQLMDGKILLFGGDTAVANSSNDTWVFDIDSNNWTEQPISFSVNKRPPKCEGAMISQIDTGKVLFYGGWNVSNLLDQTWLFDYRTINWTKLETYNKPLPIANSSFAKICKNIIVFWGGDVDSWGHYDELWHFNLIDTTWKKISTNVKPDGRYLHGISKIGRDSILLFGGLNNLKGIEHNDTWLLKIDGIEGVLESALKETDVIKSFIITNKKVNFILNENENYNYGKLYDLYGKFIGTFTPVNTNEKCTIEVNLQSLPNGMYFLVLSNNKNNVKVINILLTN